MLVTGKTGYSGNSSQQEPYYLSSTLAPASSIAFLRFSASAFEIPSLILEGAPSTRSLASLRPRPQASLTAFTTASLAPPTSARTTSKESFSSAAAASPPAAGPAATATAAAAGSIPYSSLRTCASSFTSLTVRFTSSSAIALISASLFKIFYLFILLFLLCFRRIR